ncbi:MAG: hypothetical protein ABFD49_10960 [Armatimonadota bacterium]|nr:hypothetical protein [bacterium]
MIVFVMGVLFGVALFVGRNFALPLLMRCCSRGIANLGSTFIGVLAGLFIDWLLAVTMAEPSAGGVAFWLLGVAVGVMLYYIAACILPQEFGDTAMPSRLKISVVCFNISSVLSIIVGLFVLVIGIATVQPGMETPYRPPEIYYNLFGAFRASAILVALLFIFVLAPIIRHVSLALTSLRYWAWLAGLILAGLMILNGWHMPYISTVLGGLALWGLLDKETLAAFLPRPTDDLQPTTED